MTCRNQFALSILTPFATLRHQSASNKVLVKQRLNPPPKAGIGLLQGTLRKLLCEGVCAVHSNQSVHTSTSPAFVCSVAKKHCSRIRQQQTVVLLLFLDFLSLVCYLISFN